MGPTRNKLALGVMFKKHFGCKKQPSPEALSVTYIVNINCKFTLCATQHVCSDHHI